MAEYLSSIKFDKKVYVIGSSGIAKELDRFGIRHTDVGVSNAVQRAIVCLRRGISGAEMSAKAGETINFGNEKAFEDFLPSAFFFETIKIFILELVFS